MSLNLPGPIAAYFIADSDKSDFVAVSKCFTEDAVVEDEGQTHAGQAAILQWKRDSTAKYSYTSTPFAAEDTAGKTVVTSRLIGDFPGSPLDLRYFFELDGDKIQRLEIIPRPSI